MYLLGGHRILKVTPSFVPSWARLPWRITLRLRAHGTFSHAKVVADLGGGGGSLILAVLELHPHLRGMLVDLEASVEAAKARFTDGKVSSRCKLLVADLTESVPAGADVYMLKHVLHGRRDPEAITILKNCRTVIPENGSLLVIEFILPPLVSQADPHLEGHLMSDLNMLAVTGGRERSERESKTLLQAAGFRLAGAFAVGNDVGILEAKPA
jgi:ubiquinone/menaquinone biosynthesis C-methylase UbiE